MQDKREMLTQQFVMIPIVLGSDYNTASVNELELNSTTNIDRHFSFQKRSRYGFGTHKCFD